jgi:hypothetical protein
MGNLFLKLNYLDEIENIFENAQAMPLGRPRNLFLPQLSCTRSLYLYVGVDFNFSVQDLYIGYLGKTNTNAGSAPSCGANASPKTSLWSPKCSPGRLTLRCSYTVLCSSIATTGQNKVPGRNVTVKEPGSGQNICD